MATVFKRTDRRNYQIAFFDATGERIERSSGTTDFKVAERIAREWESRELLKREGVIDPALDRLAAESRRPMQQHVDDFIEAIAKNVAPKQRKSLEKRITNICDKASVKALCDLTLYSVQTALVKLRQDDSLSTQTLNHYIRAIKQLTRWMVQDGRLAVDMLASLRTKNVDADRAYVRRELSDDELERIIETAEHGDAVLGMAGVDRAMLYRLAAGSGLRVGELASLTPESFDLDDDPPTVTVQAAYSKRKRTDVQPIRNDLAELLSDWLKSKAADNRVFALPDKTAKMLHKDLDTARQAWIEGAKADAEREAREKSDFLKVDDASGRVADFHSLRHSYISRLVSSGASVKVCQELARHSTPMLTVGRYAHTRLHDLTGALENIPTAGVKRSVDPEELRATGSLDSSPNLSELARQRKRQQSGHISQAISAKQRENSIQRPRLAVNSQAPTGARLNEQTRSDARKCTTATDRIRTDDLRFTKPLLCQLSYGGAAA